MRTKYCHEAGLSLVERQFLLHSTRYELLAPNAPSNQTNHRISMGNGDTRQDLLDSRSEPLLIEVDRAGSGHAGFAPQSFFEDRGRECIEFEFSLRGYVSKLEAIKIPNLGGGFEEHALAIQSALAAVVYAEKCFTVSEDLARAHEEHHRQAYVNYIAAGGWAIEGGYDVAAINTGSALIDASRQAEINALNMLESAQTCHSVIMHSLNDFPRGERAERLALIMVKMQELSEVAERAIQAHKQAIATTEIRLAHMPAADFFS